ncbi:receptor-type tyrosine-protein phosphatase beta-like, partial [Salvelinus fontinalis]|uniref:receptor-type tyrosine-protein phosphatase beta-like n=1 Tax=Salvelinus fontinalis TaxID=8038 RepID=UPI0024861D90
GDTWQHISRTGKDNPPLQRYWLCRLYFQPYSYTSDSANQSLDYLTDTPLEPIACLFFPPLGPPPTTIRVNERAVRITPSTILFKFNCSWFSDVNGAVRFFTVIVTESNDNEVLQTEQLHPLPSFQDYRTNSSVRAYQTGYFPSGCAQEQGMGAGQVFEVNLGAGLDRLGGPCDSEEDHDNDHNRDLYPFCDGPLKPKTAYRISVRAFTQLFDEDHREFPQPLYRDTFLSPPIRTQAGELYL